MDGVEVDNTVNETHSTDGDGSRSNSPHSDDMPIRTCVVQATIVRFFCLFSLQSS